MLQKKPNEIWGCEGGIKLAHSLAKASGGKNAGINKRNPTIF